MDPQSPNPSSTPSGSPVPPASPVPPTPTPDQLSAAPTQETPAEEPSTGFTSSTTTNMPQYAAGPQQNPAVVHTGEDPGKVLGILGIVLGIVVLPPLGIILGIMSKNRSKAAGFDGTLGQVALIVGAILTALGVLLLVGFIALAAMASSVDAATMYQ